MYTVSIKASELAKITTENYHKGKEEREQDGIVSQNSF